MEFTTGAPGVITLVADCVAIGTSSPTCRRADWLLSTSRLGDDSTRTLVSCCSACRITLLPLGDTNPEVSPGTRLKPGNGVASVRAVAAVVVAVVVAAVAAAAGTLVARNAPKLP